MSHTARQLAESRSTETRFRRGLNSLPIQAKQNRPMVGAQ